MPKPVLSAAEPSDFYTLAVLEKDVFYNDDFSIVAFGSLRGSEETVVKRAATFQAAYEGKDEASRWRYVKAVDEENGKIVGLAGWGFIRAGESAAQPTKKEEEGNEGNKWGPSANIKFCTEIFGGADKLMSESCKGEDYAKLGTLVVSGEYQRKGIGALLMEEGLQMIDELGLQCTLGASPQGIGLYKKYGFQEYHINDIKLWKYEGGQGMGICRHVIMHRRARKTS